MSYKEILDNVSNIENLDNVTILKTLEKFSKAIKDFAEQQTGLQNLLNVEFEPSENTVTYNNGSVDYLGNLKITLADNIIVNKPCSVKFNIKGSETIIVDVDEFDNALEIHLDNATITTLDFAESERLKSTTDGAIVHEKDIQRHIITANLVAGFQLTNSFSTVPLVQYSKTGNKLSMNSDGGVVIGAGVKFVMVNVGSATYVNNVGYHYLAVYKNDVIIAEVFEQTKEPAYRNIPLNIPRFLMPVSEGDIIYFKAKDTVGGYLQNNGLQTQMTVEVVE